MTRRTLIVLAVLLPLSLVAILWFWRGKTETGREQQQIRSGAVLPMTGSIATFGKWGAAGLEMAVEDINAAGGINGRKVVLSVEDSTGDPSKAVTALRKLSDVDHAEIIFSIVSSVDLALVPIAERERVILFSHASHPEITKSRKHVLRHSNTVNQEAELIADAITATDSEKGVSILYLNDDYGVTFANQLRTRIMGKNSSARVVEVPYAKDEANFTGQATRVLESKPAVVIIAGVGKSSGLPIRRLREGGYTGKIIATLAFVASDGPSAAGEAAEGVWCVEFVPPPEGDVGDLAARYKSRTGEARLPMGVVIFYNSARLWAEARAATGNDDPDGVVTHIKNLGSFKGRGETMQIQPNGDILPSVRLIEFHRK